MRVLMVLMLAGCSSPGVGVLSTVSTKAPPGEFCDGEDNDGDGVVDEDCGACDMMYTRVRSWWQSAECVVEGGGTGRSLYPITVGGNTYYSWDTLGGFLGAPGANDKQRLGQQILVGKLNSKAFGIGGLPYHDYDADGDLETVDELLALADAAYVGPDTATQAALFTIIAAMNSEGNALPVYIDQNCARDAEYCDGIDNDGDGVVDDTCGCVEVCDGLDNNGDGTADETGPDNDNDGYMCDDCDDSRSRTNPAAYDVPENAIDDDCDGADSDYTYDFDSDIQPILDASCVSCHNSGYSAGGLDLSPGVSYANIVGVPSMQLPSYNLVQPASTSLSYLYRKVMGTHTAVGGSGARMPEGGPYLSFATAGILGTWITEGAPPSCPDADGDGWECTDCDDSDPTVYPGAPEVRGDEIDQDCNDSDLLFTYGLDTDIQPLFDAYCTSCHGATVQQLGLRLDAGYTLSETVNVPATQLASMDLIEPGDHNSSYLYHKLAGSHRTVGGAGNRMPQGGPFFLAEVLEVVALWIDEGVPTEACDDVDGDIFSCSDCDDEDASVFPGAAELCDGIDQDCDGEIDEDGIDPLTWYADTDADGWGDYEATTTSCTQPEGYLPMGGDCNDADPATSPDGVEVCDGIDQDCDGAVDEDAIDAPLWFADADGDGFGDGAVSAAGCSAPEGFVGNTDDCDDADAGTYPGAAEIPGDGIDQDCNGADVASTLALGDLVAGDLVVNEIMQNPAAVTDSVGEWFEVYNASGFEVELDGLVATDGTATITVTGSLIVPADGYVVFGESADSALNGGLVVDFVYAGFALSNASDSISLYAGATLLDTVSWDDGATFPDPNGASMSLDVDDADDLSNDVGGNWCEATSTFGLGDRGTPGAVNDDCAELVDNDLDGFDSGVDCDDTDPSIYPGAPEIEDDGIDQDCDGLDATSTAGVADLIGGDLVITEIMADPTAAADATGEWFEVFNATTFEIDLNGLVVYDVTSTGTVQSSFTVSGSLLILPGDYVVFGTDGNSATNGGVPVDYDYPTWALGNSGDEIFLLAGSTIVDSVSWTTTGWVDPTAASITLDPTRYNAAANDDYTNWCAAVSPYGLGDLGTPGAPNDRCFTDPDEDMDGYTVSVDCDDADPDVNPGHPEVAADGIDNDCDGEVDEYAGPFRVLMAANFDNANSCSDSVSTGCDLYEVQFVTDSWSVANVTRLTSAASRGEIFPALDRTQSYAAYESVNGAAHNVVLLNLSTLASTDIGDGRYPDFAHHDDQFVYSDSSAVVHVMSYETTTGLPAFTSELITTTGRDPQFFPDGSNLIFHDRPDGVNTRTVLYEVATGTRTDFSDLDGCAHSTVSRDGTRALCQVDSDIMGRTYDAGTGTWSPYALVLQPPAVASTWGARYAGCSYLTFSYPEFCGDDGDVAVSVNCVSGGSVVSSSLMVVNLDSGALVDLHGLVEGYRGLSGKMSRTVTCGPK